MHGGVGEALMMLIADGLTSIRGGRTLFSGLGVSVDAGEALLVSGPNGSGKTTLIRTIAGFLRPAAGEIRLEHGDPERSLLEQCHYVGHRDSIKASLTVEENAAFWGAFLGGAPTRVDGALAAFGLEGLKDTPAAYLSAGQRRRLGLARLLLADRALWLLDEPTAWRNSADVPTDPQEIDDERRPRIAGHLQIQEHSQGRRQILQLFLPPRSRAQRSCRP